MNFVEQLQEIISKFVTLQQTNQENISNDFGKETRQDAAGWSRVGDRYEQTMRIVTFSTPFLLQFKEQYQEMKQKLTEAQQLIESKQQQNNHLCEQAGKLKNHINQLQMRQERYTLEITTLCEKYKKQDQQFQERQKDNLKRLDYLNRQNMELHQEIETMIQKFSNLEKIIRQQGEARKEVQQQLQKYTLNEELLKHRIARLEQQCQTLKTQYQHALQEKNLKINYLEQFVSQNMNQCLQPTPYEPMQQYDQQYNHYFQQLTTEQKLMKLSQQIQFNEKKLINLESFRNSKQPSFTNQPPQNIDPKFLGGLINSQTNSMRKVTSSIQLFNGKTYKGREFQHNISGLILDNPFAQNTLEIDKKGQSTSDIYSNVINISLKRQDDSSQFIKTQNTKIHIDTQITFGEDCTLDNQKGKSSSPAPDPYYIHYLLIVQSIKIEQDEQGLYGILDIDMKPYFQQLKNSKCSLASWPKWIRQKLLSIHQQQAGSL